MSRAALLEFLCTVAAIMVGLIAGKMVSKALQSAGVPISANDPLVMALPGQTSNVIPFAASQYTNVIAPNTPKAMASAGGN